MITEIIQCGDRPRIERHGEKMAITFTDAGGGVCRVEANTSQAWAMAQDILETISDSKRETNLHPVFAGILQRFEASR